jgi:hypothetical protein
MYTNIVKQLFGTSKQVLQAGSSFVLKNIHVNHIKKTNKLHGLSPRANYTDRLSVK